MGSCQDYPSTHWAPMEHHLLSSLRQCNRVQKQALKHCQLSEDMIPGTATSAQAALYFDIFAKL
ncbi:unnamed protein product [Fusarium venenatum]|uniref:Uncharacterized protein n=1 Tax=Fusarium venenatum TaxID=56646 RepID=A0A2L2STB3_9HYPO|nr:uncharacterized protein FVRRES_13441 [Fusarium venenatum]CEI41143.1 unnamed protein product [Fusarium venenatum]